MSRLIKFYYDLMSQPTRALYLFLKLNQIPYEGVRIDLAKGMCVKRYLTFGLIVIAGTISVFFYVQYRSRVWNVVKL